MRVRWIPAVVLCWLVFLSYVFSVAQQANQPQDAPFKIELSVNRILVPVVVRDKQGRTVGDLKAEDFKVFDNGKPRTASGFSVVVSSAVGTNSKSNLVGGNQLPDSPNAIPPSAPGAQRFIVFLFDDVHLKMEDLVYAQKAGIEALGEALTGSDLAAVVTISGTTNSGLTRDQAKLKDEIMSLHPVSNRQTSSFDCPNIDYHQAYLIDTEHNPAALEDAEQQLSVCQPLLPPGGAEAAVEMAARRVLSIGDVDVQQTFSAMSAYVRKMAKLPGQRALILISPGFFAMTPVALNSESSLIDLAAQSNVTISAIDARGLYVTEVNASDDLHGRSPALMAENRHHSMTSAENVMDELSDGTGGAYFHHRNDLDAGFKKLIEGPEYLYLIELPPDNAKLDGSYHRLQVKVDRDGLQLQARRGYYAPKPEKGKK